MLNVKKPVMMDLDGAASSSGDSWADVSKLWSAVKRGRRVIFACVGVTLVLAIAYLATAQPMFSASAEIIIDTQSNDVLQKQNSTDPSQIDTSLVDSQVEILNADSTALSVVRSLHLATDPEFVGPGVGLTATVMTWVGNRMNDVTKMMGIPPGPDNPERRAVEAFSKNLFVKRNTETYVITITFSSKSAGKAAKIANAVAEAYINGVLDAKYATTRRAGQWLQDRLAEIRSQATQADRAVEVFKSANNIVDTNKGLMDQQQLAELNSQLALSSASTAEAKARLDRALQVGKEPLGASTVSDALNNTVISRLRAQYLDLAAREGDLASRFGPTHHAVVSLRSQMDEINKSVQNEMRRISDAYQSDYLIASAREQSLRDSLKQLVSQSDTSSLAQVKLKDLESVADSYRALYNDYLQKFQEATQRETFPIADARVVTEATPPLKKSSPKTPLVLGGGLVLGLFFGVGLVLAREFTVDSFVLAEDVEALTGLPSFGVLPKIKVFNRGAQPKRRRSKPGTEDALPPYSHSVETYVLDAPFSRYAETIRNIKVSIDDLQFGSPVKVIGVTSSVPGEGKTTVAASFAHMIASSGIRTLLIDGDLSTRSLSKRLAEGASKGLLEALSNTVPLKSLVVTDPRSTLDFLPCVYEGRIRHRAEVLSSAAMSEFLARARESYDYVIIDMAPIMPVVDAKAIARLIDCFLMVIEWRVTSRKAVVEALSESVIHQRVAGTVLNKVDATTLKQLEEYRGKAFDAYYIH